jgi:hypothetical protein
MRVFSDSKDPGKDPQSISIQSRFRLTESDGGDGSGNVRANPWNLPQFLNIGRQLAVPFPDHLDGSLMEVLGSAVITQAGPDIEDLRGGGLGEGSDGGETAEEFPIIWNDSRNLRLLQHRLGNPYGVWVLGLTPRQRSAGVAMIPS